MVWTGLFVGGAVFSALCFERVFRREWSHRFLRAFLVCLAVAMVGEWSRQVDLGHPARRLFELGHPVNYLFGPFLYLWQTERRGAQPVALATVALHTSVFGLSAALEIASIAGIRIELGSVERPLQLIHIGAYAAAAAWLWWQTDRTARKNRTDGAGEREGLGVRWEIVPPVVAGVCVMVALPTSAEWPWRAWISAYGVALFLVFAFYRFGVFLGARVDDRSRGVTNLGEVNPTVDGDAKYRRSGLDA